MRKLELIPRSWFSNDVDVYCDGRLFAKLVLGGSAGIGRLVVDDVGYDVKKKSFFSSSVLLFRGDALVCQTETVGFFRREFRFLFQGDAYSVRLGNTAIFLRNGKEVGLVQRPALFSSKLGAEISEDVLLPVSAFLLWLVLRERQQSLVVV